MKRNLVVVGGSRGGTDALSRILRDLPGDFPLPVAVVLHRAKESDERLAEHLGTKSPLPVRDALDKDEIRPGQVSLAPADYHLLVDGERFGLSTEPPVHWSRPSIDVLFETAADSRGSGVVALVLTGSNSDGAQGARRVQSAGGLVLVQDPATALAPEMPRAAIDALRGPRTLPVEAIGAALGEIARRGVLS